MSLILLRAGFDNALAIEGARIDESIKNFVAQNQGCCIFRMATRAGGFITKRTQSSS